MAVDHSLLLVNSLPTILAQVRFTFHCHSILQLTVLLLKNNIQKNKELIIHTSRFKLYIFLVGITLFKILIHEAFVSNYFNFKFHGQCFFLIYICGEISNTQLKEFILKSIFNRFCKKTFLILLYFIG